MCRLFLVPGCSNIKSKPQQSPEYVSWCIDCSITNGKARNNVALGYIKNPGTEIIWKERGKETILTINHFTYRDNALCVTHQTCIFKAVSLHCPWLYVMPLFLFPSNGRTSNQNHNSLWAM